MPSTKFNYQLGNFSSKLRSLFFCSFRSWGNFKMKLYFWDQPIKNGQHSERFIKKKNTHLLKTVNLMNRPPNFQFATFCLNQNCLQKMVRLNWVWNLVGNYLVPNKTQTVTIFEKKNQIFTKRSYTNCFVKIRNRFIILLSTHLSHFSPVFIHHLQ